MNAKAATFDQQWRKARRSLWAFALFVARDHTDAQDLLQLTGVRAWQGYDSYREERPFHNWACRIMERLWLDEIRTRRRRLKCTSYDVPCPYADDPLVDVFEDPKPLALELLLTEERLDELTNSPRRVEARIWLGMIREGYGIEEIAEAFNLPRSTVGTILYRHRKEMRRAS